MTRKQTGTTVYTIAVRCDNCDYEDDITIPKGTLLHDIECPKCGCKTLHKDWDLERERVRRREARIDPFIQRW